MPLNVRSPLPHLVVSAAGPYPRPAAARAKLCPEGQVTGERGPCCVRTQLVGAKQLLLGAKHVPGGQATGPPAALLARVPS